MRFEKEPGPPIAFLWRVLAEFDRLAQRSLWPNFDPLSIPLALYDGRQTLLVRHSHPPQGFRELEGKPKVYVYDGRHPEVRANTSVGLGGVLTATLLVDAKHSAQELAAILIHEAFHVFQGEHHPDWCANEAELLVYPVGDIELLRLRWLETQALRRALQEQRATKAAAWAAAALKARRKRFQRMPESSVTYEQATELNEGLAQYVESLTLERRASPLSDEEFAAEEIRRRCYATGHALAQLLDRSDPEWKLKLESGRVRSLDELVASALGHIRPAQFSKRDREGALSWAQCEVGRLEVRREALRREFFEQPGWRIVIEIKAEEPLWPQGFDPMNVRRLGEREVLHTRWLKLGNALGTLEVLDHTCLTEAAGEHPLFQGICKVTLTGLPEEPQARCTERGAEIRIEGLEAIFRNAHVERTSSSLVLVV